MSLKRATELIDKQNGLTAEYPAILKLYPQKGRILGHKAYYQGGYADTWIRS